MRLNLIQRRFVIFIILVCFVGIFPQQAKALSGVDYAKLTCGVTTVVAETAPLIESSSVIAIAAPYAVPILVCAVAAGVIYANRTQILNFTTGALDYLTGRGLGSGTGIIDMGNGTSVMTPDAKTALNNYIQNYKLAPNVVTKPLINTVTIPANTTAKWLELYIPINPSLNINIGLMQTGMKNIANTRFIYRVDSYTKTWTGSASDYIKWIDGSLRVGTNVLSMPTMGHIQIGVQNTGTFDTDVGVVQYFYPDTSIVSKITPNYQDTTIADPNPIKVAPKTDFTYDDFVGLTPESLPDVATITDTATQTDPSPTNPVPTPTPSTDITVPDTVPKLDFTPLYQDLSKKFPFCVPFDFIDMIRAFKVDAVAPSFTVNFDSAYFVGGGTFTFGFEKFDKLIKVLRYLMLLGFIVGLIKKTRAWIGNGGAS